MGTRSPTPGIPSPAGNTRQLLSKLMTCDADFKDLHMSVIDVIDDEETVLTELTALDNHDDFIASMTLHIQKLIALVKPTPGGRIY